MDHPTVLVIGGSGFIGSHLVAQLSTDGWRVIVPTHRSDHARHLLLLPLVETIEADVHDEATLARLVEGMDAVINLVGILHSRPGSPYGPDFARAHVELPEKIVAACVAAGVQRYLHMSALGAAIDAPSMYLRSKAAGEQAARANPALPATIFRPSVVFGEEDHFLNLFAYLQKWFPLMPLAGADARFQPVYVGDVARAFVQALKNPRTIGKTYELAGPKIYTLRELVELAGTYTGHRRPVIALPDAMARMQAMLLEHAPGTPLITRDNLDSMKVDNVASGPVAPELELELTALEAVAPHYLSGDLPTRRRDQFRSHAGR